MKADAPKKRQSKIYITEADKWKIATYCIEHKCVVLDKEGRFSRFRMRVSDICFELNACPFELPKIKEYAVKHSMDFYNIVLDLTGKMPEVPLQDTVQDDILKAENTKLKQRISDLEKLIATLFDHVKVTYARIDGIITKVMNRD